MKIGAIAKLAEETVSTIRYWTKEGLLQVTEHTESNYALYDQASTHTQVAKIQELKNDATRSMRLSSN